MNSVERNLVYNALGRIRIEWSNQECKLYDQDGFFKDMLGDAIGLMGNQLGKDAVDMWDGDAFELEPKSLDGYLTELGAVQDFIEKRIEGKSPGVVAFDRMAVGILKRLQNFIDGQIAYWAEKEAGEEAGEEDAKE